MKKSQMSKSLIKAYQCFFSLQASEWATCTSLIDSWASRSPERQLALFNCMNFFMQDLFRTSWDFVTRLWSYATNKDVSDTACILIVGAVSGPDWNVSTELTWHCVQTRWSSLCWDGNVDFFRTWWFYAPVGLLVHINLKVVLDSLFLTLETAVVKTVSIISGGSVGAWGRLTQGPGW